MNLRPLGSSMLFDALKLALIVGISVAVSFVLLTENFGFNHYFVLEGKVWTPPPDENRVGSLAELDAQNHPIGSKRIHYDPKSTLDRIPEMKENVMGSLGNQPERFVSNTRQSKENILGSLFMQTGGKAHGWLSQVHRKPSDSKKNQENLVGSLFSVQADRKSLKTHLKDRANVFGELSLVSDSGMNVDGSLAMSKSEPEPVIPIKHTLNGEKAELRLLMNQRDQDITEQISKMDGIGSKSADSTHGIVGGHGATPSADSQRSTLSRQHDGTAEDEWERNRVNMARAVRLLNKGGDALLERAVQDGDFRANRAKPAPNQATPATALKSPPSSQAVYDLREALIKEAGAMNRLHRDMEERMELLTSSQTVDRHPVSKHARRSKLWTNIADQENPYATHSTPAVRPRQVSFHRRSSAVVAKTDAARHTLFFPAVLTHAPLQSQTVASTDHQLSTVKSKKISLAIAGRATPQQSASKVAAGMAEGFGNGLCVVLGLAC